MAKPFLIAEAGINHDGDFTRACKLVDIASHSNAEYVKFQSFNASKLVSSKLNETSSYIDTGKLEKESFQDLLKRLELSFDSTIKLRDYCEKSNIGFLSTPFDEESLSLLVNLGVDYLKVASADLTNLQLLSAINKCNKPVILSTGMGTLGDIEAALHRLDNSDVTLMHCISWYPADIETTNLKYMQTLKSAFNVPVGYSDHTLGIEASLASVALGAVCVEKHFTDDINAFGPDHAASISPSELDSLVIGIDRVYRCLGSTKRLFCDKELDQRRVHRRSLVAKVDIKRGEILSESNLIAKRPGTGLEPKMLDFIVGSYAKRDIELDEQISMSDLQFN
jgi:N,N'-diacetyllegionaminate synthase